MTFWDYLKQIALASAMAYLNGGKTAAATTAKQVAATIVIAKLQPFANPAETTEQAGN